MALFLFFIFSYILLSLSLYKIFEKTKVPPLKALIPGVNFIEWCKLIGRPTWWAALLLIPIVNIFIYTGMCVDLVRSFKKYTFWDSFKAVVYAPISFFHLGSNPKEKYDGPTLIKEKVYQDKIDAAIQEKNKFKLKKLLEKNPYKKSNLRDWTEAIAFAVFAAAFIRMFTIEAYAIPTSSMEGSLNVGDHLFVSKLHYGLRTPSTVLMVPLLHNRIPYLNRESYIPSPNLPAWRLPALEKIDRYDPVVFNMPEGDSVFVTPGRNWSLYDFRRGLIPRETAMQIEQKKYPLTVRPIDKIDHYVKHCVATPGETLQIIDRELHIDGKKVKNSKNLQFRYLVKHARPLNDQHFFDWGISQEDQQYYNSNGPNHKVLVLSEAQKAKIQAMDASIDIIFNDMYWVNLPQNYDKSQFKNWHIDHANIRASATANRHLMTLTKTQKQALLDSHPDLIIEAYDESDRLFPHDPKHFKGWTVDNYGPVKVPKAGESLVITPENIALYKRIIQVYEKNHLAIKNGRIYINGKESSQYTFQQDYYWMMGDNRNNSEDSRMWGFVPETHILGKPLFLFFSTKENDLFKGVNWDRIFTSASKAGIE
jgi:signal peptidase I